MVRRMGGGPTQTSQRKATYPFQGSLAVSACIPSGREPDPAAFGLEHSSRCSIWPLDHISLVGSGRCQCHDVQHGGGCEQGDALAPGADSSYNRLDDVGC